MKIAVYTICLNEEQHVDRFMDCLQDEADAVYVTDTGSTDRTVQGLLDRGAHVSTAIVKPWRFDTPRNISLAYVPADVDIAVCIDLDEVLTPGWRAAVERAWTPETTRLRYQYAWSHNADGSPGVSFWYDKIHSRKDYRWVKPVHEVLQVYGRPEVQTFADGFMLHHWPDATKSRSSYLPLLEIAVKEEPDDDRSSHYLGREYMYYGQPEKAIVELKRHLSLPRATWPAERCASMRFISRCYSTLGNHEQALIWAMKACTESPNDREPWYDLAQAAYKAPVQDWQTVRFACSKALAITARPTSYICEPAAWNHELYDYLALASYNLGDKSTAVTAGRKALDMNPVDGRLADNLKFYSA
jgi:tetratricopeptide (TPR) repeat protein